MIDTQTKTLFATIVGRPNVGKSSLINSLIGEKVAITSGKPQTTRTKITGVLTKGPIQYVLMDTPGLHVAKTKLGEHMVKSIKDSVTDVDFGILVTEAYGSVKDTETQLIEVFKSRGMKAILIINKIDLCEDKAVIARKIEKMSSLFSFEEIIPISVKENDGVEKIIPALEKFAIDSVHFFPDDAMTDQPERIIAAEIIREKCLQMLFEEIPHGTAVSIEKMRERSNGRMMDIEATIYCEKKTHKGMIIGKNGDMLKKIASAARTDLEDFFHIRVNLQCWVKVKDDWRNREGFIRDLGLS